jgi:FO synthase
VTLRLGEDASLRVNGLLALSTAELVAAAAARRDRRWGPRVTYSPKVFLPLTNLCRDVCDYCAFRRSPKDPGAATMTPEQVTSTLARARELGCTEALLCLGDRPEAVFPSYRALLAGWGFSSTVDYLVWACRAALDAGLLPHTNAGILTAGELARLRPLNASMGLMLESTSTRLCEKGGPHHRAPDKRPAVRLAMHEEAGRLGIPFTSGILVGIGETEDERLDTLVALRDLHRRHGHIQEVIVQRFRAHAATPMAGATEADDEANTRAIALARLVLDDEVTVQAPPNLSSDVAPLLAAGVNDFGGISPLTPDFINRTYAWPHLDRLAADCTAAGFTLAPRLPIHDAWKRPAFVAPELAPFVARLAPERAA